MRVTDCPCLEGFLDELMVLVVDAGLITWSSSAEELGMEERSPCLKRCYRHRCESKNRRGSGLEL